MADRPILNAIVGAVINKAVTAALKPNDVPILMKDVAATAPKVTEGVMAAVAANPTVAVVEVQSPLLSKTIWTQVAMVALGLLTLFGLPLDGDQKAAIITAVGVLGSFATVVFKTYFTKTIATTSK